MGSFASQVKAFADGTEEKINRAFRRSALDVLRRLVVRSPVDTGRFRGNWQTGVNDAPSGDIPSKDKGGSATINDGESSIASAKVGDSIFIVNNLPYAIALENGHSGQAPHGMVAITIAEWPGILADAIEASK